MIRGSHIKAFVEQDLVSWPVLKHQLVLDDEDSKYNVMIMAQSEVINAETYMQRALTDSEVTVEYDLTPYTFTKEIYLPMPIKRDYAEGDITITADDEEVAAADFTIHHVNTGKVIFDPVLTADKISITYNPQVYENREAVIPAILLKVTEYFTNRENQSSSRYSKADPATSIYNRHRIKTTI